MFEPTDREKRGSLDERSFNDSEKLQQANSPPIFKPKAPSKHAPDKSGASKVVYEPPSVASASDSSEDDTQDSQERKNPSRPSPISSINLEYDSRRTRANRRVVPDFIHRPPLRNNVSSRRPTVHQDPPSSPGLMPRLRSYYLTGYRSVSSWHDAHDDPSLLSIYQRTSGHRRPSYAAPRSAEERFGIETRRASYAIPLSTEKRSRTESRRRERPTLVHRPKEQRTQQPSPPEVKPEEQQTSSEDQPQVVSRLIKESFNTLAESRLLLHQLPDDLVVIWKDILAKSEGSKTQLDNAFTHLKILGQGAFGLVDEVSSNHGTATVARKRIRVPRRPKLEALRTIEFIQEEIANLESLTHPHIVRMLGSYQVNEGTTKHSYCLLMHPVGDDDLNSFLEETCGMLTSDAGSESAIQRSAWIMKWFTCLSGALAYMHSEQIHHEDIKPANIIHKGEHIFFTDFSSSRRCQSAHATSTANPARASRLFAAPEAMLTGDDLERYGSKTDVFSLGLIFVEMLTTLEGKEIDDLHEYLEENNGFGEYSEPGQRQYHRAIEIMDNWFTSDRAKPFFMNVIKPMLNEERSSRPSAAEVVQLVQTHQPWRETLACVCKDSPQKDTSPLYNIPE